MRSLDISGRPICDTSEAYVIAEIGHNHGGSVARAEALFQAAAAAGASAVKLQKRDNRSLFTQAMYNEPYTGAHSYGATYGEHREALEFDRPQYLHLQQVARALGIDFFATAFDLPSVDFLAELGVPAIKIASADLTNTPLLNHAAKTGLALVLSTGGGSMDEVRRACDEILPLNPRLALLQCTAAYPAVPEDLNLRIITTYREAFPDVVVGFSGHDLGPELSWIAYALGARVIEKHFTLDHGAKGSDHHFSLDPDQMTALTDGLRRTQAALGSAEKETGAREAAAIRKMGKKLVAARDLPGGHVLTAEDLVCKSPGDGIKPYRLGELVGSRLTRPLAADDDLRTEDLVSPSDVTAA
ncbi:N-acetylneuraminate synthase family protein [Streptomyces sp. NPDC047860]|uniref:N-acetylneuraminate synthase family protein n=1 Tax=Streptomyces sp. NPDC047860 TaxID=3155743 RepID=UPI0033F298BE